MSRHHCQAFFQKKFKKNEKRLKFLGSWYVVVGMDGFIVLAVVVAVFFIIYLISSSLEIKEEKARLNELSSNIEEKEARLNKFQNTVYSTIEEEKNKLNELKKAVFKIIEERQIGFPWLAEKISLATTIVYRNSYQKSRIYAYREALAEIKKLEGIIEFHEELYPQLKEFHIKKSFLDNEKFEKYTEKELADESTFWLTPDEYKSLRPVERNQLALDRYKNKALSNWEIGKMYERYIGFLKEKDGYNVDYDGIKYRFEDRGRDLICTKGDEVQIIQCKMWSVSKTIYENSIFQFFGTVFYAREEEKRLNPISPRIVRGLFYTTTDLSDYALKASQELGIEIIKEKMDKDYPCIKCNINNGEKIYHLPFDQQYDRTIIEVKKGEFYASTCREAEMKGFRRAFRHWQ